MTAAEASCKKDGVIIMIAACNDGHGGESLYENLKNAKTPRELLDRIAKVPRNETIPDQWENANFGAYSRSIYSYRCNRPNAILRCLQICICNMLLHLMKH